MQRHGWTVIPALALAAFLAAAAIPGPCAAQGNTDDDEAAALRRALEQVQGELDKLHKENAALTERVQTLEANAKAAEERQTNAEKEKAAAGLRAAAAAMETETAAKESEETVFRSRGLGLQALNPEISVTGDFLAMWQSVADDEDSSKDFDFMFRGLGIHIESYLDPYSKLKAAIHGGGEEEGSVVEEAYYTRYGALGGNLTLGRFRQQFGVVNRWHGHALDQVNFPLALQQIFGEEGLASTGVSMDWVLPEFLNSSNQVTLQVTNASNERLFDNNEDGLPTALVHYKNYRDLSEDTYFEAGLTALAGRNNRWEVMPSGGAEAVEIDDDLWTWVFGADFSLVWEPAARMRYRNIEWHTEFYWLDRDLLAPDGSGEDTLNAWGAYTYLQTKVARTIDVGLRLDYYEPDTKAYAESLAPLAVLDDGANQWMVSPYVTWWQSPFVKFRVQYDHLEAQGLGADEDRIWLQCVFAAGPHKHDRY
jgi:hypothetical protein